MTGIPFTRIFLYALASGAFAYVRTEIGTEYALATRSALISFTAHNPYQQRFLISLLGNFISRFFPTPNITVFGILEGIAVFLLLLAFREYLIIAFRPHKPLSQGVADLLGFTILLPLSFNYIILSTQYYPSDIFSITLFVLGLIAIISQQWAFYFVIYIFAALNRETGIFLSISLLLICFRAISSRRLLPLFFLSLSLSLLIKSGLLFLFRANPGSLYEMHLEDNLKYLLGMFYLEAEPLSRLMSFGGVWMLIPLGWHNSPLVFKKLLLILIPNFALNVVTGGTGEVRVYGELVPIILAPALCSLVLWNREEVSLQGEEIGWVSKMRSFQIGIIAVTVIAVGSATFLMGIQPRNMTINSSFEIDLRGWTNGNMVRFERSSATAYHGGWSALIVTQGLQYAESNVFPVDPNASYTLSAWVYVQKGAARIQLLTLEGKELGTAHIYANSKWYQLSFTTDKVNVDQVRISIDDYHESSEFYMDLVKLYRH
ncbi:MAG: hypothetical protein HZC38_18095 [Chloroflexi bacterium]|nr:hypothetical protein [Chloroflexota bacterium]